jgi:hypothetical protein
MTSFLQQHDITQNTFHMDQPCIDNNCVIICEEIRKSKDYSSETCPQLRLMLAFFIVHHVMCICIWVLQLSMIGTSCQDLVCLYMLIACISG